MQGDWCASRTTTLDVFKLSNHGKREALRRVELQHWMYLNTLMQSRILSGHLVELQHWMYLNSCFDRPSLIRTSVELQHWMYLNDRIHARIFCRIQSNYNIGCI